MKKPALYVPGVLFMLFTATVSASSFTVQDSCTMNDLCDNATEIQGVYSDFPFVCISACNTGATPELFNNTCGIEQFPTTWFKIVTDDLATVMNIFVEADFDAPMISLFFQVTDCSDLQEVSLTASQLPCVVGSNGEAEALGTSVGGNSTYYIAISTIGNQTGEFELCVNTVTQTSNCVLDREIKIMARSYGGSLEGPFLPGEVVSVCMNVNSFTAANNGCQWFQGLVPVFGNGWDPASFDGNGQPLNATVNGEPMSIPGNGVYGVATWDWFTDVDHHYDHPFLQVGDIDGNGTVDMCHLLYSFECPNFGGLQGGCCGPCWGAPMGSILPPGWFAYGINGSCGTPGPPISVDWGDGNTCGSGMGPWRFCFDLQVRDHPDCTEDESNSDLSLGFFTFTDGQIGSWTGSASICALDQPAKLTLPFKCDDAFIDLGLQTLAPICSGDSINFEVFYPDVSYWEHSISPGGFVQLPAFPGVNGSSFSTIVNNNTPTRRDIRITLTGYFDTSLTIVRKEVVFLVYPQIEFSLPDRIICERDTSLIINPVVTGGTTHYSYQWTPTGETTSVIKVTKPFPSYVSLTVSDEIGCTHTDTMQLKTRPCHLGDTIPPTDDDNDPDHPKDPPPPTEDISSPQDQLETRANAQQLIVYPVPAQEAIMIGWSDGTPLTAERITIADMNGQVVMQVTIKAVLERNLKIDISSLAAGVYYLSCFSAAGLETAKMVKL
jgi:hypothetical protein